MEPDTQDIQYIQEPKRKAIEQMISDRRTFINTRNRHNYKLRSANGTNLQLKSPSQLQPKGRKLKFISDQDIQSYISTQMKPTSEIVNDMSRIDGTNK